jgi:hypothetical protein
VKEASAIFQGEVVPNVGKVRLDIDRGTLLLGLAQSLLQRFYGGVAFLDSSQERV